MLDQLTLLVDKSLVVAEDTGRGTRYRLLETVRQYAQEKLHESREGDDVRSRHRDHYTAMAAVLDAPADSGYQQRIDRAEAEIDNLRAAFAWSRRTRRRRAGADVGVVAATTVVIAGPRPGRAELAQRRTCLRQPTEPPTHRPHACGLPRTKRCSLSFTGSTEAATRPSEPWQPHGNSATLRL